MQLQSLPAAHSASMPHTCHGMCIKQSEAASTQCINLLHPAQQKDRLDIKNGPLSITVLQPYLVHFSVMLPDTRPLVPPLFERCNLAPHIAGPGCSRSIMIQRYPLRGWGVHEGVISEKGGLGSVRVGGGGGSLARAVHGLEGSGGRLGGGEVEVVHPSGRGVHHGGVVVCLWALSFAAHLQHTEVMCC